jgi:hypothetical protein
MMDADARLAPRHCAGYRVLRSLARDDAAEVLLGFRDVDGGDPVAVALKSAPASPQGWRRAVGVVEALERARGEHVVELLDLDADTDAILLVFERLPHGSLAELLALREGFDAGEAVTILAPLVAALRRMHHAGVAHGAVASRTVMFRENGAPVLIGFGSSSLFAPSAPEVVLEGEAGVSGDRRAICELAMRVLSRVSGPRVGAARALVAELESGQEDAVLGLLSARLFEVAAAVPVRFTMDDSSDESCDDSCDAPSAARLVPLGWPVADSGERSGGRRGAALLASLVADALLQRLLAALERSSAAPLRAVVVRHWNGWSSGRRRAVLGVLVGFVALAGTLAVIPSAPPGPARSESPSETWGSPAATAATSVATSPADDPLLADDPLSAAATLVAARDRCLRSASLLCLESVEQPDSGALRDDRALIGAAQRGGELPDPLVPQGTVLAPELVVRLGDSALVRLAVTASGAPSPEPTAGLRNEPPSVLLVKGEAGWRIRDVVVGPKGGG